MPWASPLCDLESLRDPQKAHRGRVIFSRHFRVPGLLAALPRPPLKSPSGQRSESRACLWFIALFLLPSPERRTVGAQPALNDLFTVGVSELLKNERSFLAGPGERRWGAGWV